MNKKYLSESNSSNKNLIIIVTGTPGVGKTTLAKKIAKQLKLKYVDVHSVIEENHLSEGKDNVRDCILVDENKLAKVLVSIIKENKSASSTGLVIDSHMSHFIPAKYVDVCVVVRCDLKTLSKRLEKRKYSREKIVENLECETIDFCLEEAKHIGHKIFEVDCSEKIDVGLLCRYLIERFN